MCIPGRMGRGPNAVPRFDSGARITQVYNP
jgi:hypothetical protein